MQPALDHRPGLRRRQLLVGAVWSAPAISLVSAAPALAVSVPPSVTGTQNPTENKKIDLVFQNLTGATSLHIISFTFVSTPTVLTSPGTLTPPGNLIVNNGMATGMATKSNASSWTGSTWTVTYELLINGTWTGPYTLTLTLS